MLFRHREPVSSCKAQLPRLLLERLRRARQRRAHVPQSAQPLLLASQEALPGIAAQQGYYRHHPKAARGKVRLAW